MKAQKFSTILLITCMLIACTGTIQGNKATTSEDVELYEVAASCDGGSDYGESTLSENSIPEVTRLRFPNFSFIIHDFKGYETEGEFGNRTYSGQFGGGSEKAQAYLNDSENENEDYVETLIVVKDTIELSEILFNNRINNTLFQIIPKNENDRFKISYCYLSTLGEIIDHRNFSEDQMKNFNYDKLTRISEQTPYYLIPDSAGFFFRAPPHSADMIEVTVKNGEVIPAKNNTQEQFDWEQNQAEKELNRIKKKYHLRDTLVRIPGEYITIATLTKENRLFDYGYESFLFQIERYSENELLEKKYIQIYISYGC